MEQVKLQRLVDLIQSLLNDRRNTTGVHLEVDKEPFMEEGGWLQFIVSPVNGVARAERYADALAEVEKAVKDRSGEQIVLVPARD